MQPTEFLCGGINCWFARLGGTAQGPLPLVVMPGGEEMDEMVPALVTSALAGVQQGLYTPFVLAGFSHGNWNQSYSPWPTPALFKKAEPFGGGGPKTLQWLTESFLPEASRQTPLLTGPQNTSIFGYSLAGLFSLWAFYESGLFNACGSCSGSLWYPGWGPYLQAAKAPPGSRVYLSLGQAEEKARNPQMAAVGDATRLTASILSADANITKTTLVWQEGGHFTNIQSRLEQAMGWLVKL